MRPAGMRSKPGPRSHRRSDSLRASSMSTGMVHFLAHVVRLLFGSVRCFFPNDAASVLKCFLYMGMTVFCAWLVGVDVHQGVSQALTCDGTKSSFVRLLSCGWAYNLGVCAFWLLGFTAPSRSWKLKQRLLAEVTQYLMFFLCLDVLEVCGSMVCASRLVRIFSEPADTTFIWLFSKYLQGFESEGSIICASFVAAVHLAMQSSLGSNLSQLLPGLWWSCFVCVIHAPVVWGALANRDAKGFLAFLGLSEPAEPAEKQGVGESEELVRDEAAGDTSGAAVAEQEAGVLRTSPKKDRVKEKKMAEKARDQELARFREEARAAQRRAKKEEDLVRREEQQQRAKEEERKQSFAVEEEERLRCLIMERESARRAEEARAGAKRERARREAEKQQKDRERAKRQEALAAKAKARDAEEERRAREATERAVREQATALAQAKSRLVMAVEERMGMEGMQESSDLISSSVLQEAVQLLGHGRDVEGLGSDDGVGRCMEESECVVCLNGVKTMCVVPCLHKALCSSCADVAAFLNPQTRPFTSCPICRQEMVMPYFMDAALLSHIHKQKIFET